LKSLVDLPEMWEAAGARSALSTDYGLALRY